MSLTEEQNAYWLKFLAQSPYLEVPDLVVTACMPGNAQIADQLVELYLSGKKKAGSGLVKDYQKSGDPLPQVGSFTILLDSRQRPRAVLRTIKVVIQSFDCVKEDIAEAEGEGDLSLEYWQKAHREFFAPYLKGLGIANLDPAEIVTEFYERLNVP